MAQNHKDTIRALVEGYARNSSGRSLDVIRGKGDNLIIVLQYNSPTGSDLPCNQLTFPSGPPGVEKTLTAETISETKKSPLYSVG